MKYPERLKRSAR